MIYLHSPSVDPYFNLALEQTVFDDFDRHNSFFMLWQNDNTIVVGKNQNTAEQINAGFVKAHNINVVRRLSGGGAVYHDLGNLNFTFITDAKNLQKLDLAFFCRPIAETLKELGVENVEIGGRNDITISGLKFSGNAQYIRHRRIMHHGTIMFNSDLSVLSKALNVSDSKIVSKGIKSVSSRVTNIADHLKTPLTLDDFKQKLLAKIAEGQELTEHVFTDDELAYAARLRDEKYIKWDWNYGKSPDYTMRKKIKKDKCGEIEVFMNVSEGRISDICFYGDYFGICDSGHIAKLLIGKRLNCDDISAAVSNINIDLYFHNLTNDDFIEFLTGSI
jgi:lipoate-protein ligase A